MQIILENFAVMLYFLIFFKIISIERNTFPLSQKPILKPHLPDLVKDCTTLTVPNPKEVLNTKKLLPHNHYFSLRKQ